MNALSFFLVDDRMERISFPSRLMPRDFFMRIEQDMP